MDKDAITLDILRKEYEFISKSIDDQSKYMSSLFTFSLGLLTVLATTIVGLYKIKADTPEALSSLIRQNIDSWGIFLLFSSFFLLFFRFVNLQTIVQNSIYKEHLEKQINYILDRDVLIWNHKVLKAVGLAPYQLNTIESYINTITWLLFIFCLYSMYTASSRDIQDKLYLIAWPLLVFLIWYGYIVYGLPKRLKKRLLHRISAN